MTRRHTGRRGGGVCGLLASPPWLGLIITAFTKSMIDWSGIGPISHTPLHIAQSQQERRGGEENEGVAFEMYQMQAQSCIEERREEEWE